MRITHPFHPLTGRELDLVRVNHNWHEERVCLEAADGQLLWWLPRRWTSLEPPEPFVQASAGKAAFRSADLLELAALLERLREARGHAREPDDV